MPKHRVNNSFPDISMMAYYSGIAIHFPCFNILHPPGPGCTPLASSLLTYLLECRADVQADLWKPITLCLDLVQVGPNLSRTDVWTFLVSARSCLCDFEIT